ncbi:Uncharacterised protein [Mycobacteroides abscessus subsp. massiliense]|nr:Uncharacterised protein [Mycobacteroides abscessus subsp. massiliense]
MNLRTPVGSELTMVVTAPSGLGTVTWTRGFSMMRTTAAAMSSGSTGFWAPVESVPAISSVLVKVGSTALTWTPCGANSSLRARESPTTPNLDAL